MNEKLQRILGIIGEEEYPTYQMIISEVLNPEKGNVLVKKSGDQRTELCDKLVAKGILEGPFEYDSEFNSYRLKV